MLTPDQRGVGPDPSTAPFTLVPPAFLLHFHPKLSCKPAYQDSISLRASWLLQPRPRCSSQTPEWILGTDTWTVQWACASGPWARQVEDSGSARWRHQRPAACLAALGRLQSLLWPTQRLNLVTEERQPLSCANLRRPPQWPRPRADNVRLAGCPRTRPGRREWAAGQPREMALLRVLVASQVLEQWGGWRSRASGPSAAEAEGPRAPWRGCCTSGPTIWAVSGERARGSVLCLSSWRTTSGRASWGSGSRPLQGP